MNRMLWLTGLLSGVLLFTMTPLVDPVRAMEDEDCMDCHGDESILNSGDNLYIDPATFAATTHAAVGCTSCHESVSDDHPDDGSKPSRAQCGDCHEDVEAEYEQSVHYECATCTSCHNPHEVRNPVVMSGVDENRPCAQCHDPASTVIQHATWLPRTRLHLDSVPCIACHTGSKDYMITLYIQYQQACTDSNDGCTAVYDKAGQPVQVVGTRLATYDELASLACQQDLVKMVDRNSDGFISLRELKKFNESIKPYGLRLWGMFMPEEVTHSYQILDNRWDCSFCHASGSRAMQKSYLAIPTEEGTYKRLSVERGAIMDALFGTPNFYMLAVTRNPMITALGILIVAGGAFVPLAHGTMRFLTRKNRKGDHHDEG